MKTQIIRKLQRGMKTIITPALESVYWKSVELEKRLDALTEKVELQNLSLQELTMSMLYERWEKNPHSIFSRSELGYWLTYLGLLGKGVEIGSHKGKYSEHLLRTWPGNRLVSVDPWKAYIGDEYIDLFNVGEEEQQDNYLTTIDRLKKFGCRSEILRKTSQEAAGDFENSSLDFVYIDAQHQYEAVKQDLHLWDCKVKKGGLISGHDYLDGQLDSGLYGVKRAVDEWSEDQGYKVRVSREGPFPSWFVIKPN